MPGNRAMRRYSPVFVDLVHHALLSSFWRVSALKRFLRQMGVGDAMLGSFQKDETKRQFLDRFFEHLESSPTGDELIGRIAAALAEQTTFPDLVGWEDSKQKNDRAREAVASLKDAVEKLQAKAEQEAAAKEARAHAEADRNKKRRTDTDLAKLADRMNELAKRIGEQKAGYEFQDWFYDLMDHFEIVNRRPYNLGGRQIDGTITVSGTTYLVETKFTASQSGATDIDSIVAKVSKVADNTMGILISMSGFSATAISQASGPRTPLLLLDSQHVYAVLTGTVADFKDLVNRLRRHASQTGESYLPMDRF
jgi:hypothetical protein